MSVLTKTEKRDLINHCGHTGQERQRDSGLWVLHIRALRWTLGLNSGVIMAGREWYLTKQAWPSRMWSGYQSSSSVWLPETSLSTWEKAGWFPQRSSVLLQAGASPRYINALTWEPYCLCSSFNPYHRVPVDLLFLKSKVNAGLGQWLETSSSFLDIWSRTV